MKKIIITYGLIAGAIVSFVMFATQPLWDDGIVNFDNGMVIGLTSMVIALSVIFFAIRSYRDKYNGGTISFMQGVKIGLLISLIAAIMYALAWEITFHTMATDFVAQMSNHYLETLKKNGASESEIAAQIKSNEEFATMYQNTLIRFAYTLVEILPVGIIITLLSAGLLRKREIAPSA